MMGSRVVLEFGCREEVRPPSGVIGAEDMEICFNLLVGLFCLSVHLWVVSGGKSDIVLKKSS